MLLALLHPGPLHATSHSSTSGRGGLPKGRRTHNSPSISSISFFRLLYGGSGDADK